MINFSDKKYLEKLKEIEGQSENGDRCEFTAAEAFFELIKELPVEDLENLCIEMQTNLSEFYGKNMLTLEETYEVLQGKDIKEIKLSDEKKKKLQEKVLKHAYKVIESKNDKEENNKTTFLGNKTINEGKINTSSWLSHSLYVAKFAEILAKDLNDKKDMNLDVDSIKALALLHDYGRKYDHTIGHVAKGAEELINRGYVHAAVAPVMHSFFSGKRCANNEPAEEGFLVDDNGKECWEEGTKLDDITKYLDMHKLTITDLILNLGDLVATDKGIVHLSVRLEDIAKRRPNLDKEPNREFFLLQVINGMVYIFEKLNIEIPKNIREKFPKLGDGITKAEESIEEVSKILYNYCKEKEYLTLGDEEPGDEIR